MATAAAAVSIPFHHARRNIKTPRRPPRPVSSSYKVAVLGAGGEIGRTLSLLVKMSPYVRSLNLYDDAGRDVGSVAESLSHCNTPCHVKGFSGTDVDGGRLGECVSGADVVVVVVASDRAPAQGHDEDELIHAQVESLTGTLSEIRHKALVHVVSDKVDSIVPGAAEVLKKTGVYDPRKLFGVTTLDAVRASTFAARKKHLKMLDVDVPVIGGHGRATSLPLLSKMRPRESFTQQEAAELTTRVRNADVEVAEAKGGRGSATLSAAYAASRFVESSLRALDGEEDVEECAFVESSLTELPFFASRVRLGKGGVEAAVSSDLDGMTDYEEAALEALKPVLMARIEKGSTAARRVLVSNFS